MSVKTLEMRLSYKYTIVIAIHFVITPFQFQHVDPYFNELILTCMSSEIELKEYKVAIRSINNYTNN